MDALDSLIEKHEPCMCGRCENQRWTGDWRDFLSVFFSESDQVYYRMVLPRESPYQGLEQEGISRGIKYAAPLSACERLDSFLCDDNARYGVFFVVNAGGQRDAEIKRFTAFYMESDKDSIDVQNGKLDNSPIRPSIRVETRKSVHAYWLITGACNVDEWRDIQMRLIQHFKADPKIKNPSRVMRLPYFDHISYEDKVEHRKQVTVTQFHPQDEYSVKQMQKAFKPFPPPPVKIVTPHIDKENGWDDLNERTRNAIKSHPTYRESGRYGHAQGVCHNGKGLTAIFVTLDTGQYGCMSGCTTAQIRQSFGLPTSPERR